MHAIIPAYSLLNIYASCIHTRERESVCVCVRVSVRASMRACVWCAFACACVCACVLSCVSVCAGTTRIRTYKSVSQLPLRLSLSIYSPFPLVFYPGLSVHTFAGRAYLNILQADQIEVHREKDTHTHIHTHTHAHTHEQHTNAYRIYTQNHTNTHTSL